MEIDAEDLREWSERIWAAHEYRYGNLRTIKEFVEWVGRSTSPANGRTNHEHSLDD